MSRPDVPRYSRVPETFWSRALSWPDEIRVFALYAMTSAHRTLEGIFLLPIPYAGADLRWPEKKVSKAIASLTEALFLRFDSTTNTMLIMDALKVQAPENENQAKSCLRRIANLPRTELLAAFLVLAKQHCYRTGASAYAQTFYQLLEQQLTQQLPKDLGEPLFPLNLQSSSVSQPLPNTSNPQPRLNGGEDGREHICVPQREGEEERKEAETRKRFPHLAQTTGFESFGEIRRKSKSMMVKP